MKQRNAALLSWYERERRDLPWRRTRDPWPILVSEVMAQQTQVSRVADRFPAFMVRFPTPSDLAVASTAHVLEMWSGLGYNRRGLRLRSAARQIVDTGWPTTPAGLQALPGVGRYTAAAVACFAFGEQVPAIDTNLRRVLTRWRGRPMTDTELTLFAADQLEDESAEDWNQAIMDLGASLCRPSDPSCGACPVAAWCVDPVAYRPPRPQGRFEGSQRQARGAVVRALLAGPATNTELVEVTRLAADRVAAAAHDLAAEGIVTGSSDTTWALQD